MKYSFCFKERGYNRKIFDRTKRFRQSNINAKNIRLIKQNEKTCNFCCFKNIKSNALKKSLVCLNIYISETKKYLFYDIKYDSKIRFRIMLIWLVKHKICFLMHYLNF